MSLNHLKDDIDELDIKLFGSLWTVNGQPNVEGIESETPDAYEGVSVIIHSVMFRTDDLPDDIGQHQSVIRQSDDAIFTINKILPEVENMTEILLSEE